MRTVKEHDERKTEIIDTAERFFLSKGYDKTTINDILKSIGIAKGTFYHYFKSKEEVMDAVIMRVIEQDMLIARKIVEDNSLSAFDKVFQFFISQSSEENNQKKELLEQFPKVENALMRQRALEGSVKYVCPILAEMVEAGNNSGEFNTDYPLEVIQFLVTGIQSLLDEGMLTEDEAGMLRRLESFAEIIYRVLGMDVSQVSKEEVADKFRMIVS